MMIILLGRNEIFSFNFQFATYRFKGQLSIPVAAGIIYSDCEKKLVEVST